MSKNRAAADELETFIGADLRKSYLGNTVVADLDCGIVFAEPAEHGLIRVWVCEGDEDGYPTDTILAERWIAILPDPTAIDFGP